MTDSTQIPFQEWCNSVEKRFAEINARLDAFYKFVAEEMLLKDREQRASLEQFGKKIDAFVAEGRRYRQN